MPAFMFLIDFLYAKGDFRITLDEHAHIVRETAALLDEPYRQKLQSILKYNYGCFQKRH
jgi:hypothetical protein